MLKGDLLTQESERSSIASVRNSAVAPETAKDHASIDVVIVVRTTEAK